MLLWVGLLDELGAGVPVVGAPEIRGSFELAYGGAALVLLVLPEVCSWLLEPPLFVLSDRIGKRRLILIGLASLGVAFILAGLAPSALTFTIATIVIFPASGLGVGLCQAALMDAYPRRRVPLMARWTLLGTLGDGATPLLLSGVVLAGGSWRWAMVLVGLTFLAQAALTARVRWRAPKEERTEQGEGGFLELVKDGLRNRRLWLWSTGVALCGPLDEMFLAFGSLYMRDVMALSRLETDIVLTICALGSLLGLALAQRWSHLASPLRLLTWSSIGCAASFLVWLFADGVYASALGLFLLGLFVAPQYPIVAAQAYASSPGRSGTVAAVAQLLAPLRLGFAFVVGAVADEAGLVWALALLLVQPAGLVLLATLDRRAEPPGRARRPSCRDG